MWGKREYNKRWQKSLKVLWHEEQLQICLIIGSIIRLLFYRNWKLLMIRISRILIAHFKNYINKVNEPLNAWRYLFFFFSLSTIAGLYENRCSKIELTHKYIIYSCNRLLYKIDTDLLIYYIKGRSLITCPLSF